MSELKRGYYVLTQDVTLRDEEGNIAPGWQARNTDVCLTKGRRFEVFSDGCIVIHEYFGSILTEAQSQAIRPFLEPAPSKIGQWLNDTGINYGAILAILAEQGVVTEDDIKNAASKLKGGNDELQAMERNWVLDREA